MKKRKLSPVGVIIKKRLIEMGKTQYQLAAEVGTSSNYIYLIMIGERSGRSFIPKIAQALGLDSNEISKTA
ncbi:helix-turn-helix domain-containing protein [Paenibacillus sp. MSJ-34]|uniref:helix-turn-helix domain-containing protein n=1 Tax=Paenibacillus sp. MSJ-34 TaxID=2841529 RepID=UPI001C0FC101|nr:helix-turn-helix transcriptional regulator [Paenibacillus sp. MSJ-34]MBU5442049.1 helix-turn-helix domain-containing protein [Paenibacillus sp. MSJ-34]